MERRRLGYPFHRSENRNVRKNYMAQLQTDDFDRAFHSQLLAHAREAVKSMRYFRQRTAVPLVPVDQEESE